jgi:hypothetical protein
MSIETRLTKLESAVATDQGRDWDTIHKVRQVLSSDWQFVLAAQSQACLEDIEQSPKEVVADMVRRELKERGDQDGAGAMILSAIESDAPQERLEAIQMDCLRRAAETVGVPLSELE